jgi:hypothetical protein
MDLVQTLHKTFFIAVRVKSVPRQETISSHICETNLAMLTGVYQRAENMKLKDLLKYLRSLDRLIYLPAFMDPEGPRSCTQNCIIHLELSQVKRVSIAIFFFFKIHFNIITHPITGEPTGCIGRRNIEVVNIRP